MKKIILISLVILWISFSLYVRILGLEKSPVSVGFDEASLGYNAYSLLLTGKDEYGTPYPLSLRSFNDFKPALYAYLSIPFIYFLDLNQTSTRAASAVFGTLSLIFLLFIFKKLSKASWALSLFVLTFISFLPWRLHFSRVALESNLSMAFFTGTIWALINFQKNIWYKVATILFATLSIYSYHSARVAIPVVIFLILIDPLTLHIKKTIKESRNLLSKLWPLLIIFVLYIPMLLDTKADYLLTRLGQTNVFGHFYPFTPGELITSSSVWFNLLANPLYYLGALLSGHLFAYLSPQNLALLIYPGVVKSAQVISGSGMLGFVGGVIFIIGLFSTFLPKIKTSEMRILLYWILAGILPAAITWEWFYPLRSLNIYPAIDVILGFGLLWIVYTIHRFKNKLFVCGAFTVLCLCLIVSSTYNLMNELNYGAWDTNGEFQPGGYKEGAPLLLTLKDKYKTVYIDTPHAQSYIMLWFYMKYPPEKVQALSSVRNKPGAEGPPTIDFDNFVYKKFSWPSDQKNSSFVYWTSSEVRDEEITKIPSATLYKIQGPLGNWPVTIITKE